MTYPFQEIHEKWGKGTVYLIGGGTSLTDFDFSVLKGRVIGINRSAFELNADALFTLDQTFVRNYRDQIADFVASGKRAYLTMPVNDDQHVTIPGATYLLRMRGGGLSDDPARLFGVHSGYAAINLAYLCGAKKIGLLGYDMAYSAKDKTHFHDGYKWHGHHTKRYYIKWAHNFDQAKLKLDDKGIKVTNYIGKPKSAITIFPTKPLESLL